MEPSSTCVACKHPIPDGASKCAKCGTMQNVWRFLPFGQNSLALVIALTSVIGLVGDRLYDRVAGEYSNIRMAPVASSQLGVTVLASNTGTRAGVLSGAELEVVGSWGNAIFDMNISGGATFVEAGDDVLVEFVLSDLRPLKELLDAYLDSISLPKENAEAYDCLISVEHVLYEDTLKLSPMASPNFEAPGAKASPETSFITRSLSCWDLGLPIRGVLLSPADNSSE